MHHCLKINLLFLLLFFSVGAEAQLLKGQWMLNGSLGYNSNTSESVNEFTTNNQTQTGTPRRNYFQTMQFQLSLPYFIKKNLAFGIGPDYSSTVQEFRSEPNENKDKNQNLSLTAFLRKYKALGDKFFIYGQVQASVGRSEYVSQFLSNGIENSKTSGSGQTLQIGLSFGTLLMLSKQVGVHAGISNLGWYHRKVNHQTEQNSGSSILKEKSSGFNFGLSSTLFQFGLNVFFNAVER